MRKSTAFHQHMHGKRSHAHVVVISQSQDIQCAGCSAFVFPGTPALPLSFEGIYLHVNFDGFDVPND